LYYEYQRWYDPSVGRFISQDPAIGSDSNPYLYVSDSPTNYIDPSGLDDCSINPLSWLGCLNNGYQGTVNWYNGLSPKDQEALKILAAIGIGAAAVLFLQPELFGLDAGLFGIDLGGTLAALDLGGGSLGIGASHWSLGPRRGTFTRNRTRTRSV